MVSTTPLLTRKEAAEALRLSPRMIDILIAEGEIPVVRIGRSVRVRPASIDRFVEARETRGNLRVKKGGRA